MLIRFELILEGIFMAINIRTLNPWNWMKSGKLRAENNSGAMNRRNQWLGADFVSLN